MMDLRQGILATAQSLGIDPIDLGTAISYETAGTFDPTKAGPTTQWGQHRGLIQFGEPQAKQYGVDWNDPIGSQLGENGAVARYLRGAGVKPGMGMMDIYSAINAGSVGRYGASDANNGGAPGTVADKVNGQMAGHREKAMALLGNITGGGGNTMIAGNPQQDTLKPEGWLTQDRKDALIVGLEGMTMNPNEALVGMAGGRIADRRAEAKSSAAKSKTTEWLRSIGRDDLAAAVESGAVDGSTAAGVALTPVKPDLPPEAYQVLTLRAQAAGLQPGTPEYQAFMAQGGGGGAEATSSQKDYEFYANQELKAGRAPLSFNDWDLQARKAGASNVTFGGESQQIGTIPQGYAVVPDATNPSGYRMAAIPGGPEDTSGKTAAAVSNANTATDVIVGAAKKARELAGGKSTGLLGAALSYNPESDAAELYRQVDVLKSNASIENLTAMRAASPTGGALGAISDKENAMLSAKSGALDPKAGPERFQAALDDYERTLLRIVHGNAEGDRIFEASRNGAKVTPATPGTIRRKFNPATGMIE